MFFTDDVFKPIGGMPPMGFFGEGDRRFAAMGGMGPEVVAEGSRNHEVLRYAAHLRGSGV